MKREGSRREEPGRLHSPNRNCQPRLPSRHWTDNRSGRHSVFVPPGNTSAFRSGLNHAADRLLLFVAVGTRPSDRRRQELQPGFDSLPDGQGALGEALHEPT
jgi:hypothetical protein